MPPIRPGDIIKPTPLYRFIPFGVLSLASYGLCVLAVALVGVGLARAPEAVLSSFKGVGLALWICSTLVCLALILVNLMMGSKLSQRRLVIGAGQITIRSSSGKERSTPVRGVSQITIIHSTAAIQSLLKLKYADGRRVTVDTAGFDSRDVSRLAEMIGAAQTNHSI